MINDDIILVIADNGKTSIKEQIQHRLASLYLKNKPRLIVVSEETWHKLDNEFHQNSIYDGVDVSIPYDDGGYRSITVSTLPVVSISMNNVIASLLEEKEKYNE